MKLTRLLPLALGALLALPSCDKDDEDDAPSLEGDWVIEAYEYAGNDFDIYEGAEVEFDDGEFDIAFDVETANGPVAISYEGEYDLDGDELELEYEEEDDYWGGLFGFYLWVSTQGQVTEDILEEESEIEFDGDDELVLTSDIGGNDLEITLERD